MAVSSILNTPRRVTRGLLDSHFVESLVTPNPVERYIGMIDPVWSRRDVRAKVIDVVRQTPRSATITLRPNSNWTGFEPGQHVGVTVEIDGRLTTRFYSPANASSSELLELTVTRHPDGKVSEFLVDNAAPGLVVGLSPPEGEFLLPSKRPDQLLLISGGSGITPVMSMLRTLCAEGHDRPVTFLHFSRTKEDIIYAEELSGIAESHPNVSIVTVPTREGERREHLTARRLKSACPDHRSAETYVCGPGALVEAAEKLWSKDKNEDRLHVELFKLPEPKVFTEDATGTVTFTRSGISVDNDGRSLLLQAEAGNLSPQNGCRMGICHTCVCRVESGTVRHVRTGEVKNLNNELVQICVNAPVGDFAIDL
ncbi:MAG: ferredoxin reductase [Thermoleophilaceae bacterium]|nr:ferredoxin reductase [Thermoleophilaceae bacterium]